MAQAAFEHQPPFDGKCQIGNAHATATLPLQISRVAERSIHSASGVSVNPLFVTITVAGENSVWEAATVPLLFCQRCHSACRRWFVWETMRLLMLVPLLVVGGVAAFFFADTFGVVAFVLLFVLLGRALGARRIGRRWEARLARIPLVREAIAQESELHFRLGKPSRE